MFIRSMIDALEDSRIKAAEIKLQARVGERSLPIIGGMWSNLRLTFNHLSRFVTVPAAFFLGAHHYDKAPDAPPLPKEFDGTELGDNLKKAYKQECDVAHGKAASAHCLSHLDIVGYKRNKAVAVHSAAQAREVTLPEEKPQEHAGAAAAGVGAAMLGQLVSNIPGGPAGLASSLLHFRAA